ncbi:MAG TPA: hypothetical protein VMP00_00885 [Burkholderiales bacterium]|nr:hypothetical protein [Burkholderiales bacterium]
MYEARPIHAGILYVAQQPDRIIAQQSSSRSRQFSTMRAFRSELPRGFALSVSNHFKYMTSQDDRFAQSAARAGLA